MDKKLAREFKEWLRKKGLTYEAFSKQAGVHYSSVMKWGLGTKPRDMAKTVIKASFPDCPLVKE